MHPALDQFITDYPGHILMGLLVFAGVGIALAVGTFRARAEREYKLALLDRGLTVSEIERLTSGPARRRTLFEQFAALSGGAKAGVIIGAVLVANMLMAATIAISAGHAHGSMIIYESRPAAAPAAPAPVAIPVPMPPAAIDELAAGDDGGC